MALGDPYATLAELKTRLGITDTTDDTRLSDALNTASRGIEKYCRRQFNKQTGATARVFYPCGEYLAKPDDFWTTASLVVATDQDNDGTFEITWASTDYQLEPLNGIVDGESGWPYWRIRSVLGRMYPVFYGGPGPRRASLQVTAQWGWTAVPSPVHEACLVLAEDTFKLASAPFGVAGFGELGVMRVGDNQRVTAMLAPYRRDVVLVA
jgi:Phage gp6-like head-tail connector protein